MLEFSLRPSFALEPPVVSLRNVGLSLIPNSQGEFSTAPPRLNFLTWKIYWTIYFGGSAAVVVQIEIKCSFNINFKFYLFDEEERASPETLTFLNRKHVHHQSSNLLLGSYYSQSNTQILQRHRNRHTIYGHRKELCFRPRMYDSWKNLWRVARYYPKGKGSHTRYKIDPLTHCKNQSSDLYNSLDRSFFPHLRESLWNIIDVKENILKIVLINT